jgi:hypothetical protein
MNKYKQLSDNDLILLNEEELKYTNNQLNQLLSDINDINYCMDVIGNLIDDQQVNIDIVSDNLNVVDNKLDKGIIDLQIAEKLAKKSFGIATILTLTTTGLIIGGPVGATIGFNSAIGITSGLAVGTIMGGTLGLSSGVILRKLSKFF